jgi:hypothetical protein
VSRQIWARLRVACGSGFIPAGFVSLCLRPESALRQMSDGPVTSFTSKSLMFSVSIPAHGSASGCSQLQAAGLGVARGSASLNAGASTPAQRRPGWGPAGKEGIEGGRGRLRDDCIGGSLVVTLLKGLKEAEALSAEKLEGCLLCQAGWALGPGKGSPSSVLLQAISVRSHPIPR